MERRKYLDREAIDLAEWLLQMGRHDGRLPIPVDGLVRCLGARVFPVALPKIVRGVCDRERRIILVNRGLGKPAQRFVIAHELSELLILDMGLPHGGWQNQFAGHLLVPLRLLIREASGRGLDDLAEMFEVGEAVIAYQLRYGLE